MRVNRLFQIVAILLNKNMITARELAQKLEVSTRTIYRDIDILSSSGIPIFTNKGVKGGISILENYTLDKTVFSQRQKEELIINLKSLGATKYLELDEIIDKLSGLFQDVESDDWIEVDFSDWGSDCDDKSKFNLIRKAIIESRVLGFDYYNSYGQKNFRTVNPMKLIFKSKSWYLFGFCKLKEDFRIFKINRISNIEVCNDEFIREDLVSKPGYKLNMDDPREDEMVSLKLKFSKNVKYLLFDYFNQDRITKLEDDDYIVDTEFPMSPWVYSFLLSFGDDLEVIEPGFIRKEIISRAQRLILKYKDAEV